MGHLAGEGIFEAGVSLRVRISLRLLVKSGQAWILSSKSSNYGFGQELQGMQGRLTQKKGGELKSSHAR